MRFSGRKNRISQRGAMAIVVLVALVAFACLTGCSSSWFRSTKAIAVADTNNSRVLIYDYPITTDGQAANVVLGQADFSHATGVASAVGMDRPEDVAEDIVRTSCNILSELLLSHLVRGNPSRAA